MANIMAYLPIIILSALCIPVSFLIYTVLKKLHVDFKIRAIIVFAVIFVFVLSFIYQANVLKIGWSMRIL